LSDVELTIVPQSPIQITIVEPTQQVLEINPPAVIELSNVTIVEGTGGGSQTILGTENEIVVTTVGDVSTISIADPLFTGGISCSEIGATNYYGSNMELYGSISLPYGNIDAPAGTITAPHHHGNLLGGVEVEVKNTYAGTLPKGHPVYAVGSVGATDVIEVYPATADSYQTVPILGLLSQQLTHNQTGHAITHGLLEDLDTSQWDVGDNIWVASASQASGLKYYGLSAAEPAATNDYNQRCAIVVRSNNNNGSLLVLGGDAGGKTIPQNIPFNNINNCTNLDDATYQTGTTIVWQGSGWAPAGPGFFSPFNHPTYLNGASYTDPTYGSVIYGAMFPDKASLSSAWDGKVAKWDETNTEWVSISASEVGHTHSGADITSGTVAFARLPTGTTSSTVAIGNHTHTMADITDLREQKIFVECECNAAGEFSTISLNSGANSFTGTGLDTTGGHYGILTASTSTNAAAVAGIGSADTTTATVFGTFKIETTAILLIPSLSTSGERFFIESGWTDNRTGVPTDGVLIQYCDNVNSGKFIGLCYNNSSLTSVDLGITVAANTWYKLNTVVNADRSIDFYIDGVLKGQLAAGSAPNGSTRATSLSHTIRKSAGTTSRGVYIDYINYVVWCSR
jgi:hypothetical protein